jgi:hypothetical protein
MSQRRSEGCNCVADCRRPGARITTINGGARQMRFRRLLSVFMIMFVPAVMVAAQTQTGQDGPPQKHLIMTITGFAEGSDIPLKYTQAGSQTSPEITWINTPPGTVPSFCTCMIWTLVATTGPTTSFIGLSGIFRARRRGCRKVSRRALSCRTEPIKSARAGPVIEVQARQPVSRGTITPLNFLPWTRRSTSSQALTRLKFAQA